MRRGSFSVAGPLARSFDTGIKQIMGKCIIVRAEYMFTSDTIEYIAISEHFRDVPDNEVTPMYAWYISATNGITCEEVK